MCNCVPPTLVVVFECLLSSAEERRRRSRFWKQNCVCMRVYNKSLTLLLLVVVVLHALRIYWAQALPSHHPMPNVAAALLYSTRHQAGGGQGGQAPPGIIENKCLFNKQVIKVLISCSWLSPWTGALGTWQCPCVGLEATYRAIWHWYFLTFDISEQTTSFVLWGKPS